MINKYDWDLEALLEGESLNHLFNDWSKKYENLIQIYNHGKCYTTIISLKKYLNLRKKVIIVENKLTNYISNKLNENLSNQEMIKWNQKLSRASSDFEIYFANELNEILNHKNLIKSFIYHDKEIKQYSRFFNLIFREEDHKLSNESETLLLKIAPFFSSFSSVFTSLTDSEIPLLSAQNGKGKEIKFNSISDIDYILEKSKDRILRKNTLISLNKSYINFENTLTTTLFQNFYLLNELAKIYNHQDYIHQVCFNDEIETEFIDHVYSEVKKYQKILKKFYFIEEKFRKKKMNLVKIESWDKWFDIYKLDKNKNVSIEETKEIILDSLVDFGNEYISVIKKAFSENWISWLPKKNKTSGAYSISNTKGLNKYYILINFDKTMSSILTVAHELGHSLNSYFTNKNQEIYYETEIFDAEIPSITNEIIVSFSLLNKFKNNKKMKLKIYYELINNFFNTTSRQIMFSYTEKKIIDCINKNIPISANEIKAIYAESFKEFAGFSDRQVKNLLKNNGENLSIIFRLNHFYDGVFYVYKYAIGMIVGVLCADKIVKKEENFIEKYISFLSSGTSLSPIEKIKLLGIDLFSNKPWLVVYKMVNNWIDEYKKLIG